MWGWRCVPPVARGLAKRPHDDVSADRRRRPLLGDLTLFLSESSAGLGLGRPVRRRSPVIRVADPERVGRRKPARTADDSGLPCYPSERTLQLPVAEAAKTRFEGPRSLLPGGWSLCLPVHPQRRPRPTWPSAPSSAASTPTRGSERPDDRAPPLSGHHRSLDAGTALPIRAVRHGSRQPVPNSDVQAAARSLVACGPSAPALSHASGRPFGRKSDRNWRHPMNRLMA